MLGTEYSEESGRQRLLFTWVGILFWVSLGAFLAGVGAYFGKKVLS